MTDQSNQSRRLLSVAALVSLTVLILGGTGLFALQVSHSRNSAAQERVNAMHQLEINAETVRADYKTQVQEWKNILLRGALPADFQRYRAQFLASSEQVSSGLQQLAVHLEALGMTDIEVARFQAEHATMNAAYAEALVDFDPQDPAAVRNTDAAVRGVDRPLNELLESLVAELTRRVAVEQRQANANAASLYQSMRRATLIAAGLAMAAALGLVWMTMRVQRQSS